MTDEFFEGLHAEPAEAPEHVTPDHKATRERPGIFARAPKVDSAPKNGRVARSPKPRKATPSYRPGMFTQQLTEMYAGVGLMLMPFKPRAAAYLTMPEVKSDGEGGVMLGKTGAEKCADAWDKAAEKSEAVRRMLDSMLTVTVWGAVISAHVPLVMALIQDSKGSESTMDEQLKKFTSMMGTDEA